MAGSVNKVILVGNLGRDPEVRHTSSGTKVVNLRIATSETWKDKATGERKEKTEWHTVVIFNEHIAQVAEQYCKKGSKVYVEGKLRTRKWVAQDGTDHYTTEVVLEQFRGELSLLDRQDRSAPSEDDYGQTRTRSDDYGAAKSGNVQSGGSLGSSRSHDIDDDIPF